MIIMILSYNVSLYMDLFFSLRKWFYSAPWAMRACENKSDLSVTFGDFELKVLSGR